MAITKYLLLPFTLLYSLAVRIRNFMYNKNWRPSVSFETNVIVVGNLEAGGTGKTPMITYLVELLRNDYSIATLSRGYRRKTKGFRIANTEDNSQSLGDEPYQVFRRYGKDITVAVGESRETAIPFILAEKPDTQVVLMDDGFQYRTVKPGLSIVLTRYERPFFNDWLLPSGRLREPRKEIDRADVIVVTKCPENLSSEDRNKYTTSIRKYSEKPVFFSTIKYGNSVSLTGDVQSKRIVLLTGIAHPDPLKDYLESHDYEIVKHFRFPDHHYYSPGQINEINKYASSQDAIILTTEKDSVKLNPDDFTVPVCFVPIVHKFIENGMLFEELLTSAIREYELPY